MQDKEICYKVRYKYYKGGEWSNWNYWHGEENSYNTLEEAEAAQMDAHNFHLKRKIYGLVNYEVVKVITEPIKSSVTCRARA